MCRHFRIVAQLLLGFFLYVDLFVFCCFFPLFTGSLMIHIYGYIHL